MKGCDNMSDKKRNQHAFNLFKLLSLIIVSSCLEVLELTINVGGTRRRLFLYAQVPEMVEYLIWSALLLFFGALIWYIAERYESKRRGKK